METRHPAHPEDFESYTTARMRRDFLIQNMFQPGRTSLVYSHVDRMIVGGACPTAPLALEPEKAVGTSYFLERREMGVINVGGAGTVRVDGREFKLQATDCLYVGRGSREVVFLSDEPRRPAKFYLLSGPAHAALPTARITAAEASPARLGSPAEANARRLTKYIHPEGLPSCQLVMGFTTLEPGSVWNSMPCHTHERRMEVYFYFDLAPNAVLFHFMGEPERTRHLVVRNEEAVISPSWSIHTGVGTASYSFVWGMLGENQTFTDMDAVDMGRLA